MIGGRLWLRLRLMLACMCDGALAYEWSCPELWLCTGGAAPVLHSLKLSSWHVCAVCPVALTGGMWVHCGWYEYVGLDVAHMQPSLLPPCYPQHPANSSASTMEPLSC